MTAGLAPKSLFWRHCSSLRNLRVISSFIDVSFTTTSARGGGRADGTGSAVVGNRRHTTRSSDADAASTSGSNDGEQRWAPD